MKVTKSWDTLEFDNGLTIEDWHDQDCCESNYLDFEQLQVGDEFPNLEPKSFIDYITLKEDGFAIKTTDGTPKWVQARSSQNGYYSSGVGMVVKKGDVEINIGEVFSGEVSE